MLYVLAIFDPCTCIYLSCSGAASCEILVGGYEGTCACSNFKRSDLWLLLKGAFPMLIYINLSLQLTHAESFSNLIQAGDVSDKLLGEKDFVAVSGPYFHSPSHGQL